MLKIPETILSHSVIKVSNIESVTLITMSCVRPAVRQRDSQV